jgi:hypothetical protein
MDPLTKTCGTSNNHHFGINKPYSNNLFEEVFKTIFYLLGVHEYTILFCASKNVKALTEQLLSKKIHNFFFHTLYSELPKNYTRLPLDTQFNTLSESIKKGSGNLQIPRNNYTLISFSEDCLYDSLRMGHYKISPLIQAQVLLNITLKYFEEHNFKWCQSLIQFPQVLERKLIILHVLAKTMAYEVALEMTLKIDNQPSIDFRTIKYLLKNLFLSNQLNVSQALWHVKNNGFQNREFLLYIPEFFLDHGEVDSAIRFAGKINHDSTYDYVMKMIFSYQLQMGRYSEALDSLVPLKNFRSREEYLIKILHLDLNHNLRDLIKQLKPLIMLRETKEEYDTLIKDHAAYRYIKELIPLFDKILKEGQGTLEILLKNVVSKYCSENQFVFIHQDLCFDPTIDFHAIFYKALNVHYLSTGNTKAAKSVLNIIPTLPEFTCCKSEEALRIIRELVSENNIDEAESLLKTIVVENIFDVAEGLVYSKKL